MQRSENEKKIVHESWWNQLFVSSIHQVVKNKNSVKEQLLRKLKQFDDQSSVDILKLNNKSSLEGQVINSNASGRLECAWTSY